MKYKDEFTDAIMRDPLAWHVKFNHPFAFENTANFLWPIFDKMQPKSIFKIVFDLLEGVKDELTRMAFVGCAAHWIICNRNPFSLDYI